MLDTWKPVLVVDDNPTIGRIITRLLRDIGFEDIAFRTKAIEGMRELKTGSYGLVISEIDIQPISGVDFVRLIRRDPTTWQLPILLMTVSKASAAEAFSGNAPCQASALIFKPFTGIELKTKISELLEARFTNENLMPTQLARLNGDWAHSRKREILEENLMARIRNVGIHTVD